MALPAEALALIEEKLLLIAEDFPSANILLVPALELTPPLPAWSVVRFSEVPPEAAGPEIDPAEATIAIGLPTDLYEATEQADTDHVGRRFTEICLRPVELSEEERLAFRLSAKAAIAATLERGGDVWIRAAAAPLGHGIEPTPFSVQRVQGNYWIAVPPRWMVSQDLGFKPPELMAQLSEEVLSERVASSPPSTLN